MVTFFDGKPCACEIVNTFSDLRQGEAMTTDNLEGAMAFASSDEKNQQLLELLDGLTEWPEGLTLLTEEELAKVKAAVSCRNQKAARPFWRFADDFYPIKTCPANPNDGDKESR
jgi:hypothetical protein